MRLKNVSPLSALRSSTSTTTVDVTVVAVVVAGAAAAAGGGSRHQNLRGDTSLIRPSATLDLERFTCVGRTVTAAAAATSGEPARVE